MFQLIVKIFYLCRLRGDFFNLKTLLNILWEEGYKELPQWIRSVVCIVQQLVPDSD